MRLSSAREFTPPKWDCGEYRPLVTGNRSGWHLLAQRLTTQPCPGAATGSHMNEPHLIRTYGVSLCRPREWRRARPNGSSPPHAWTALRNTLPTVSGLLLNPIAVGSMASGSAMRTGPTLWICFHRRSRAWGSRPCRSFWSDLPWYFLRKATSIFLLFSWRGE